MATTPKVVTLTNSSVDILNAIRNNATQNYRDYVPYQTDWCYHHGLSGFAE